MKHVLILIFLCHGIISIAQVTVLKSIPVILISPDLVDDVSSELVDFYVEEYETQKSALSDSLNSTVSYETQTRINEDMDMLEDYLRLWNEVYDYDRSLDFLEEYDLSKCYEIKSNTGTYTGEEIELTTITTMVEKIAVEYVPSSKKLVRKKIYENCESSNPMDCYVSCFEMQEASYTIIESKQNILATEIPVAYAYDKKKAALTRDLELEATSSTIMLKQKQTPILILDWLEEICE